MDALQFLKNNIQPIDLLNHYNAKHIEETTNHIRCACPIHNGDNPSAFLFNKRNKLWFCHSGDCGGGDIVSFVMKMEGLPFKQAIQRLAAIFNLDISNMDIIPPIDLHIKETERWIKAMRSVHVKNELCEYDLSKLGKLYKLNGYKHFTKETLEHFNVMFCKYAEIKENDTTIILNNRIIVPIYHNNIIVGASGRATIDEKAKWVHIPYGIQTSQLLYNLDSVIGEKTVIIVEGCTDVWNLYQNGYTNAVATFGAHLTKDQQQLLLKHFYNIILLRDNDKAGNIATQKEIFKLWATNNLYVGTLPESKDPGEATQEELNNAIQEKLHWKEWLKQHDEF